MSDKALQMQTHNKVKTGQMENREASGLLITSMRAGTKQISRTQMKCAHGHSKTKFVYNKPAAYSLNSRILPVYI